MAKYDPAILEEFADRLYTRAQSIIGTYTVLGIVLGFVAGLVISSFMTSLKGSGISPLTLGAILAVVGGIGGFQIGREKAFWIKLEAQRALCALQTEFNTRKGLTAEPDAPDKG